MLLKWRFQHYEFMRRYKPLLFFFIVDFASYSIEIFVYSIELLPSQNLKSTFIGTLVRYLYILNIGPLLAGLAIIYLKDNSDVIQEISKLDYLCKVSIFQKQTFKRQLSHFSDTLIDSQTGSVTVRDYSQMIAERKNFYSESDNTYSMINYGTMLDQSTIKKSGGFYNDTTNKEAEGAVN